MSQLKSKTDPEALLNDLSTTLKSFSSTVRTWTTDANLENANNNRYVGGEMRPARLGLGAKPVRNPTAPSSDSVSANLTLKKQLTGTSQPDKSKQSSNNRLAQVQKAKKKGKVDEDDEGGRASMIKSKQNPKKLK